MKKVYLFFLIIFLFSFSLIFTGCKNDIYDRISISLSETEIEIVLNGEDNLKTVEATITGSSKVSGLSFFTSDNEVVVVDHVEAVGDKTSRAYIKALAPGRAKIVARSSEGNKTAVLNVNVVLPVENINFKDKDFYILLGDKTETLSFNSSDFIFNPSNTSQKDLKYSISYYDSEISKNEQSNLTTDIISISESGVLTVSNKLPRKIKTILVTAESLYNKEIITSTTVKVFHKLESSYVKITDANDNVISNDKNVAEVELLKNKGITYSTNYIKVIVPNNESELTFSVYDLKNNISEGVIDFEILNKTTEGDNTIYSCKISCIDIGNVCIKLSLYNRQYKFYDNIAIINVSCNNLIDKILINGEDYSDKDVNSCKIIAFNNYTGGVKGTEIIIGTNPLNYSNVYSGLYLKPIDNIFDEVEIYQNNTKLILNENELIPIEKGSLYIKGKNSSGEFKFVVCTKFSGIYEDIEDVSQQVNVIIMQAITDISVEKYNITDGNISQIYSNTYELNMSLKGELVERYFKLKVNEGAYINDISVASNNDNVVVTKIDDLVYKISGKTNCSCQITIKPNSGNSNNIYLNVNIIKELENVDISIDKSSDIGKVIITDNNVSYMAVDYGKTIKLNINNYPSNVKYDNIKYYYCKLEDDVTNVDLSINYNFVDKSDILSIENNLIRTFGIGTTLIKVVVNYEYVSNDGVILLSSESNQGEGKSIVKYFIVTSYRQISKVYFEKNYIELYERQNLGEYNVDESLFKASTKILFNPTNATIKNNTFILNYDTNYLDVKVENNEIFITAKNLSSFDNYDKDLTITISYIEYERVISANLNVKLKKVQRSNSLVIYNLLSNQIYLDILNNRTYNLQCKLFPEDTFNKGIYFKYIPTVGSENIISISENGEIKVVGNVGGAGRIMICAMDSLIKVDNEWVVDINKTPAYYVDIVVSDGNIGSEYFINNASDLLSINEKGLDKNYIIKNDIDASMITSPIGYINGNYIPFTGTINFNSNKVKIYNLNINAVTIDNKIYNGLFIEIAKDAKVNNLILEYTLNNSNFVVNDENIAFIGGLSAINYGTVENVSVNFKVDIKLGLSGIFGGLVALNGGQIKKCEINNTQSAILFTEEDIEYISSVGGLAGINFSLIEDVTTNFLFNGKQQSNVGGLVGINYLLQNYEQSITKINNYEDLFLRYTFDKEYINEYNLLKFIIGIIDSQNVDKTISNGATINNVISYSSIIAKNNIGGLIGNNFGYLYACSYEIEDEGHSIKGNYNVGGIVGSNFFGALNNCYSYRFIENDKISTLGVDNKLNEGFYDIEGLDNVGGLIGLEKDGVYISECFVNLSVYSKNDGEKNNGGLIGYLLINQNDSIYILNCYSEVIGNNYMGGLIGRIKSYNYIYSDELMIDFDVQFNNLNMDYCYSVCFYQNSITEEMIYCPLFNRYDYSLTTFDTSFYLSPTNISNFGVNKTLEELRDVITYKNVGFDIIDLKQDEPNNQIWYIADYSINNSLPYLSYEKNSILVKPSEFNCFLIENSKVFKIEGKDNILYSFYYEPKNQSVENINYVKSLNKFNIKDFLNFNFSPYNSKTSLIFEIINPSNLVAKIEDNSTITLLAEGTFILKIKSKFNTDLVKYIQICVNKVAGDLELFNSLEYNENLEKLTEDFLNYLKIGKNSPLFIYNSDKNYNTTNNTSFTLESSKTDDNDDLSVVSSNGSNDYGLYNVTALNKSYKSQLIVKKYLNLKFYSNTFEDFSNNIFTQFDDAINILIDTQKVNYYIYSGIEEISIDKDSATIESGSNVSFVVTKVTDIEGQDSTNKNYAFNIIIKNNNETVFNNDFFFEEDIINKYFNIKEEKISQTKDGLYYTISYKYTISFKDDINSRLFSEKQIFNFTIWCSSNSEIKETFTLNVNPQEISSIKLDHYSSGLTSVDNSGKTVYYPQEQPSSVIAPGKNGILTINVYPYYAYYDYLEVTSESEHGYQISFEQVVMNTLNNSTIFVSSDSQLIENGIRLNKVSSNENVYDGNVYVRTLIPSNVDTETVFTVYVKPYSNGKLIEDKVEKIILQSAYITKINIKAEDEESKYLALGVDSKIYLTLEDKDAQFESPVAYNTEDIDGETKGEIAKVLIQPSGEVKIVNGLYVYEYTVYPYLDCKQSKIKINVNSWKVVNNIKETTSQSMYLYIKDFLIKDIFISDEVDNELNVYYGIEKKLQLDVLFSESPYNKTGSSIYNEKINEIEKLKEEFVEFLNKVLIEKILYYQKNDSNYSLVSLLNDKFKFVVTNELDALGKVSNYYYNLVALDNLSCNFKIINNLQDKYNDLSTEDIIKYNKFKNYFYKDIEHDVFINVKTYSDDNTPIAITTVEELYSMKDGEYYILLPNESLKGVFEIENHKPLNVNIGGLDGNGKIIKLKSFDTTEERQYYGFFETVYKNSLIRNLTIDISELTSLNLETNSTVVYGTIAGKNDGGIITNCEVISTKSGGSELVINTSEYLYNDGNYTKTNISIAGLVGVNNGSLTNSRFGGYGLDTLYDYSNNLKAVIETAYNKYFINIKASGNVAGICVNNNGIISSCSFYNASITTNESINNLVAGFVLNNNTNASIYLSYSKGEYNLNNTDVRFVDKGIESYGIIAGFVYQNNGEIADSYSNIPIYSNGNKSSGFVYDNQINGIISRCYSLSKLVTKNLGGFATLQNAFIGSNDLGDELLNKGKIDNSYFYYFYNSETEETERFLELDETIISKYGQNMAIGINSNMFTKESSFNGFAINKKIPNYKSVWYMTSSGPELVSPNLQTKSVRYIKQLNGVTYMPYLDEFSYGKFINPILITTAEEFNKILNPAENSIYREYYSNGKVFGNYRLVYNISFSSIKQDEDINNEEQNIEPEVNKNQIKLETSNIELTSIKNSNGTVYEGIIDGNGLKISGIEINTAISVNNQSIGLFSKITGGAVVKNLNLEITNGSANSYSFVGGLSGIIEDSVIINVNIYDGTSDKSAVIMGLNAVGGLAGKVVGESYLYNISSNISVRSTKEVNGFIDYSTIKNNKELQKEISYAGGIAGIYDCYSLNYTNFISTQNAIINASKLYVYGNILIQGNVVGGLFGYIGDETFIKNATFELNLNETNSSITQTIVCTGSYAGGIVGLNKGRIDNVTVEHSDKNQKVIDEIADDRDSILNKYYLNNQNLADEDKLKLGNTTLFSNYGDKLILAIGGLIGRNDNGIIYESYSKVDVSNLYANYAGGITGYNNGGKYYQVFATGDVIAKEFIGGIIGFVNKSSSMPILNVVTAANFYKKWNYDKYVITIENTDSNYDKYIKIYYDKIESTDENGVDYTTFIKIYPIGYNYVYNQSDFKNTLDTTSLVKEVYAINKIEFIDKTLSTQGTLENFDSNSSIGQFKLSDIKNPNDSTNRLKINTFLALGDSNYLYSSWIRNSNQIFPKLLHKTTIFSYYIDKYEDFDKILQDPSGSYMLRGVKYDKNNVDEVFNNLNNEVKNRLIDGHYYIVVPNLQDSATVLSTAVTFTGSLTGKTYRVNETIYYPTIIGFNNSGSTANFIGLFNYADGAIFKDFNIDSFVLTSNTNNSESYASILVAKAVNSNFKNITISNCKLNSRAQHTGMLSGFIDGGNFIEDIKLIDNNIKIYPYNDIVGIYYNVGILSGYIGGLEKLEGVKQTNCNINIYNNNIETNVNAGLIIGSINNIKVNINPNLDRNQYITGKIEAENNKQINIGGLIGSSLGNDSVNNIFAKIDITVTSKNLNVGGIVGFAKQIILNNIYLGEYSSDSLEKKYACNYEIKAKSTIDENTIVDIGGIVGSGKAVINNCNVKALIDSSFTEGIVSIGGLCGETSSYSTINNSYFVGSINSNCSNSTSIGGIVGNSVNGISILNNIFAGDITLKGNDTGNKYISGVIGKIGNEASYNVKENTLVGKITSKLSNVYVSSVVGSSSATNLTIESNNMALVFDVLSSYNSNIFVGNNESFTATGNNYSSQLSEFTFTEQTVKNTNYIYNDQFYNLILEKIDNRSVVDNKLGNIGFVYKVSGNILNPILIDNEEKFKNNINSSSNILLLKKDITITSGQEYTLEAFLIGGGKTITIKNINFNGQNILFKEVSNNAKLSGVNINLDILQNISINFENEYLGGITNINNGTIMYTSVVGKINIRNIKSSFENLHIGAVAGQNKGKINYCVSNADLISTTELVNIYQGNFVGQNGSSDAYGYINNSYSTGISSLFNYSTNFKEVVASFVGKTQKSNIKNCYAIGQVNSTKKLQENLVLQETSDSKFGFYGASFDNSIFTNCYFDILGVEVNPLNIETIKGCNLLTDDINLNIYLKDDNKGINYSYPVFNNNLSNYKNLYLVTTIKTIDNITYYFVPNINVFKSMAETSYNYIQTRDIYAQILEDFNGVENFSGTFDGNNFDINNLVINPNGTIASLFVDSNNSIIKNVNLFNIKINGKNATSGIYLINNNTNSTIENCIFQGTVIAADEVINNGNGIKYTYLLVSEEDFSSYKVINNFKFENNLQDDVSTKVSTENYGFTGGGTEENPYQISSVEDLLVMLAIEWNENDKKEKDGNDYKYNHYILTTDIVLNGKYNRDVVFTGYLNGNGYKLKNLIPNNGSSFISELNGSLKNLIITNGYINNAKSNSGGFVGKTFTTGEVTQNTLSNLYNLGMIIIGKNGSYSNLYYNKNDGIIYITSNSEFNPAASYIGGIAGYVTNTSVTKCSSYGMVKSGDGADAYCLAYNNSFFTAKDSKVEYSKTDDKYIVINGIYVINRFGGNGIGGTGGTGGQGGKKGDSTNSYIGGTGGTGGKGSIQLSSDNPGAGGNGGSELGSNGLAGGNASGGSLSTGAAGGGGGGGGAGGAGGKLYIGEDGNLYYEEAGTGGDGGNGGQSCGSISNNDNVNNYGSGGTGGQGGAGASGTPGKIYIATDLAKSIDGGNGGDYVGGIVGYAESSDLSNLNNYSKVISGNGGNGGTGVDGVKGGTGGQGQTGGTGGKGGNGGGFIGHENKVEGKGGTGGQGGDGGKGGNGGTGGVGGNGADGLTGGNGGNGGDYVGGIAGKTINTSLNMLTNYGYILGGAGGIGGTGGTGGEGGKGGDGGKGGTGGTGGKDTYYNDYGSNGANGEKGAGGRGGIGGNGGAGGAGGNASSYIGGVIGYAYYFDDINTAVTIKNLFNYGNITLQPGGVGGAGGTGGNGGDGGVGGNNTSGASGLKGNGGNGGKTGSYSLYTSGVIGYGEGYTKVISIIKAFIIENVYNSGNIELNNSTASSNGGILGQVGFESYTREDTNEVITAKKGNAGEACKFNENIENNYNSQNSYYLVGNFSKDIYITNGTNEGKITCRNI